MSGSLERASSIITIELWCLKFEVMGEWCRLPEDPKEEALFVGGILGPLKIHSIYSMLEEIISSLSSVGGLESHFQDSLCSCWLCNSYKGTPIMMGNLVGYKSERFCVLIDSSGNVKVQGQREAIEKGDRSVKIFITKP